MRFLPKSLADGLNINALAIEIEDVATQDGVLADNRPRSHQFRHGFWLGLAIVVHQPHVRAREGKAGLHSRMEAAGAARILFQSNQVEFGATTRRFAGKEFTRRLIRSIVDNH